MNRDDMNELYSHMEAIDRILNRDQGGRDQGGRDQGGIERERRMDDRSQGRDRGDRRTERLESRPSDGGRERRSYSGRWDENDRRRSGFLQDNLSGPTRGLGDDEKRVIDTIVRAVAEKVTQSVLQEMERRFPILTGPGPQHQMAGRDVRGRGEPTNEMDDRSPERQSYGQGGHRGGREEGGYGGRQEGRSDDERGGSNGGPHHHRRREGGDAEQGGQSAS